MCPLNEPVRYIAASFLNYACVPIEYSRSTVRIGNLGSGPGCGEPTHKFGADGHQAALRAPLLQDGMLKRLGSPVIAHRAPKQAGTDENSRRSEHAGNLRRLSDNAKPSKPSANSNGTTSASGGFISRVLSPSRGIRRGGPAARAAAIHLGRLLPNGSSSQPGSLGAKLTCRAHERTGARPLFGLAPGGVCHAGRVAKTPVRSCRTLSPLPVSFRRHRRYTLCGTFPKRRPERRCPAGVTRHPCFVEPGLSSLFQTRSS